MIKENQLESEQSYHARETFGYGKRQPEPEPETFICGLCTDVVVPDENSYCPACQAAEAEYQADQMEDR